MCSPAYCDFVVLCCCCCWCWCCCDCDCDCFLLCFCFSSFCLCFRCSCSCCCSRCCCWEVRPRPPPPSPPLKPGGRLPFQYGCCCARLVATPWPLLAAPPAASYARLFAGSLSVSYASPRAANLRSAAARFSGGFLSGCRVSALLRKARRICDALAERATPSVAYASRAAEPTASGASASANPQRSSSRPSVPLRRALDITADDSTLHSKSHMHLLPTIDALARQPASA